MGIDLQFLASNFRERDGKMLATTSVRADRDPRFLSLFAKNAVPSIVQPLPPDLKVGYYEDEGLKYDDKDSYGQPLTFTTPEQLKKLPPIEEINAWNRAALAFLLALPLGTRIVLYWC